METIFTSKVFDLDQGEDHYDAHHDFSAVLMNATNVVKFGKVAETLTPNLDSYNQATSEFKMESETGSMDIMSLEFGMEFYASKVAFMKKKKAIAFHENGKSKFRVNLQSPEIQNKFTEETQRDPRKGLSSFIWWCFEQNKYETI